MAFDASGIFTRLRGNDSWKGDATAGTKIRADLHDDNDNDIANSLSECITKTGKSQPTADIPWGGKKITNLGAPVNPNDAATRQWVLDNGLNIHTLPAKAVPVDADEVVITDSAAAWLLKRTSLAELKATFSLVPAGAIMDYAGTAAPTGWLLCFGQAVSRTTYSALFAAIGTTYALGGEAPTDFRVPDLRGFVVAGKDNMGGTSANRLTTPVNGDNLGAVGGTEGVALTVAQMPLHQHPILGGVVVAGTGLAAGSGAGVGGGTTDVQGSGAAHNNVQPTAVLNKIIKT